MRFKPDNLKLDEIINSIVNVFEGTYEQKGVDIELNIPEGFTVFADEIMLDSILRNLISNAVKFTNKGGRVSVTAHKFDDSVVISVKDTGIGMSNETMNDLFKQDKQTNRLGTDNEPSTGLGLYLCKEFTEKHKGKI